MTKSESRASVGVIQSDRDLSRNCVKCGSLPRDDGSGLCLAGHSLPALSTESPPVSDVRNALELARPIVEADLHVAIGQMDADWEGMSRTALEAIDKALAHAAVGEGYAVVPVKWNLEMYSVYHSRQDYAKSGEPLSISDWWPHFLKAASPLQSAGER